MSTPTDQPIPHYLDAEGKLAPWQWRALYDAARTAGDRLPVVLLKDGRDRLTLMRLEDFNTLMDAIERKGNQ